EDRARLAPAQDHPSRVLPPAVVGAVRELPELLVAVAVAGPERGLEARLLAPLPELVLEDLALVSGGELEERLLLVVEDDRGDELGQPLPFLVGKLLDAGRLARRLL